jgi:hypothetical protein
MPVTRGCLAWRPSDTPSRPADISECPL